MQVAEVMTRNVRVANVNETIEEAAKLMAQLDAGFLPVGESSRLVGTITDRDIAVRAVAEGKGPQTKVQDIMTDDIKYCFSDQDIDDVLRNMGDIRVRRLAVLDHQKRLVGVISLGDIATSNHDGEAGAALAGISRSGDPHSQTG